METRGERITPMSMSIQKPDSFGRSLSDGLESARPVTPIVPDPPFHANVFFRDSSQFFFFSFCLSDPRAVTCLLCHKAYACPMTLYATRTTTTTFSVQPGRKRNQGSTKAAARGVPIKTPIITVRRLNSEKKRRHIVRTHILIHVRTWARGDTGTSVTWARGVTEVRS